MQLALGVGGRSVPAPLTPKNIVEIRVRALVHARTQIDEALRPFDQHGQDIGRERVDGEDMRQAVAGQSMPFAIADGGVVNDGVEGAERVDLGRQVLGGGDAREVADDDSFGLGQGPFGVRGAGVVARMQDDLVALIGEKLAGHEAETIGRTGNEDARHDVLPTLRFPTDIGRLAQRGVLGGSADLDRSLDVSGALAVTICAPRPSRRARPHPRRGREAWRAELQRVPRRLAQRESNQIVRRGHWTWRLARPS